MYDRYLDYIGSFKQGKVLDIGCGDGNLLSFLKKNGFLNVYGVDIDKGKIEICQNNGLEETELIDNLENFLINNPVAYEIIIAREVIYYFEDEKLIDYLIRIKNSLADNGIFIVEVFNGAIFTGNYVKNKDYQIRRIFTENSLKGVLEAAGFKVLDVFGNRTLIKSSKMAIWAIFRQIWFTVLRIIYLIERGLDPNNPKIFSKSIIAVAKKGKGNIL